MFFIPESPRWLILQGRYEDGVKSLAWVRPAGSDVRAEADEIQAAIDQERETASGVGVLDMFRDPVDRRRTLLSLSAVTLQAASGSMFIIGESAPILDGTTVLTTRSVQGLLLHHGQRRRPLRHEQRPEHHRAGVPHYKFLHCRALGPTPPHANDRPHRVRRPAADRRDRV